MRWIEDGAGDLRYALRQMRRAPAFAAMAIGTLAIGIGANTAIFSVVNAVLVRPLPYKDADRLVHIVQRTPALIATLAAASGGNSDGRGSGSSSGTPTVLAALDASQLDAFRAETRTLSHVVAHGLTTVTITGLTGMGADAIRLDAALMSPEAFDMLGVQPLLGRALSRARRTDTDTAAGASASAAGVGAAGVGAVRAAGAVGTAGAGDLGVGADAEDSIILSYTTWQREFHGDRLIVGRAVTVDGRIRTIVAVMPPRFAFPDAQTQCWIPYVAPVATPGMRPPRAPVIARVKEGVTLEAATIEVNAILSRLQAEGVAPPPARFAPDPAARSSGVHGGVLPGAAPDAAAMRFGLVGIADQFVAPVRPALVVLTIAVGFVLLIACVNVANLLLARMTTRAREMATRRALGADRGRVVRQAMTESVCLACAGGVAGIALAYGGLHLLRTIGTTLTRRDLGPSLTIPRLDEVGIDASVLAFTMIVSVLTGLLFGVAPALRQSEARPIDVLRQGMGSAATWRRNRAQACLVIAEIAMALLLFVGGGLLARSFVKLSRVDPGYDAARVLTFQLTLPADRNLLATAEELAARLRSLPGVSDVGYTRHLPMARARSLVPLRTTPALPTEPAPSPAPAGAVNPPQWPDARHVSAGYMNAMRIRMVAGRSFDARDDAGRPQVMLINETLARSGLLGQNPVGWQVYTLGLAPWEVIGIVDDVRQAGLDYEPGPQVFIDLRQLPGATRLTGPMYFVVRTGANSGPADRDLLALTPHVRRLVQQIDPLATIDHVAPMDRIVSNSLARPRLYATLMGLFAIVAVLLAAVGIYGVVSYGVTQRTREIGIRMALGAHRADVIRLMLAESGTLIGAGLALGLTGAILVTRYLRGMLFGLTPLDLPTFAAVSIALAIVATLASYAPARRATRIDPLTAIRHD